MRLQRARQRPRRRRDVDDDRALEIHTGEVVDAALGNAQPVADERQRRLQGRRRIDAQVERGVVTERQRLGPAIAHQREARLRFDDAARLERHGLDVAVHAGRREPGFLELGGHVLGGAPVAGAAGVAPLHAVVGERFDVRKPSRGRLLVGSQSDRPRERRKNRDRHHSAHES